QPDEAAARPLGEVEQPEQRGLSRARRAGQEIEGAGIEHEADVRQRLRAGSVAQTDILELHDARHRGRACSLRPFAGPPSHSATTRVKPDGAKVLATSPRSVFTAWL